MVFEPTQLGDVARAEAILTRYAEMQLDLVDCCIVALAERLNLDTVITFDYRDFSAIRPAHREFLSLLPEG